MRQERFNRSRAAESAYSSKLGQVGRQVDHLIKGLLAHGTLDPQVLRKALFDYSLLLAPWARAVAGYMMADVAKRDAKAWMLASRDIGQSLRSEITHAPTGALLRQLMDEQVQYITSIPRKAAEEVHALVLANASVGARSDTLIPRLMELGAKSQARAKLIARTETARTASLLTQARAQYIGSEGYFWRTSKDRNVRDSHAEMEGKYVRWDTVPKLSDGTQTHAGQIYNCRCWAEPVLPDLIE